MINFDNNITGRIHLLINLLVSIITSRYKIDDKTISIRKRVKYKAFLIDKYIFTPEFDSLSVCLIMTNLLLVILHTV